MCVNAVLLCGAQAGGLTLWVKRTDVVDAEYSAVHGVPPTLRVDALKMRWVASEKLDVTPSLVSLRLVPHTGEDEPTAAQEAAATTLNPRKTLAAAGVADGSWLVAVFAGQLVRPLTGPAAAPASGAFCTVCLFCTPRQSRLLMSTFFHTRDAPC